MKEKFNHLINQVDRNGIESLKEFIEQNNFFISPSSSQYHGAKDGGNLEHSILVTELMLQLHPLLAPDIPTESVIITGLFHDIGKANYFDKPLYIENILKSGKRSDSKPFKHNEDRLPIPHEVVSLHMLSKFIPLTEDEVFAILYHNGMYTPLGRTIQGKERPLMLLLHFADMWSSRFLEKDEQEQYVVNGGMF